MLLLSRIMLAMLLDVVLHCVDGNQVIVCASKSVSDDEDFSGSSGNGESDGIYDIYAYENHSCNSLDYALASLSSNILINITTDVMLSSAIVKSYLHNISIIGHNNPTVKCKTDGGIHFTFCHNCIIQGITWHGCGSNTKAGLTLINSSNITIQNCTFQHSVGQAIVLSEASGDIRINYCNFVNNNQYRYHGTAIHYSGVTGTSHFVFNITNCRFSHNGNAASVIYIDNSIQHGNIYLHDSIFRENKGPSIFLVNQKLYLNGKVLFESNKARDGAGINIRGNSTVVFGENSKVAFIQNSAMYSGGAIFLKEYSSVLFDQNANIKLTNNSAGEFGSAICSLNNSYIIFTGKSNITFNRNQSFGGYILHGTIYLGKHAYVSFQGHATTTFSNNEAFYGGAIYSSNISFTENSFTSFSNNIAHWGGAVHTPNTGHVSFEGNSTTRFSDNSAVRHGGAIRSDIISFGKNSFTLFSNNAAHSGGAIRSGNISFVENAFTLFSNNTAAFAGGALRSSITSFGEDSFTSLSNNTARWGGAVFSSDNGYVSFEGNSTAVFNSNNADHTGGAIRSYFNTHIYFKANSTTVFSNNIAVKNGAALSTKHHSDITFDDNSKITFTSM